MAHIEGEVLIRRPVDEVFDFVAGERTEPTYNRNMSVSEISRRWANSAAHEHRAEHARSQMRADHGTQLGDVAFAELRDRGA